MDNPIRAFLIYFLFAIHCLVTTASATSLEKLISNADTMRTAEAKIMYLSHEAYVLVRKNPILSRSILDYASFIGDQHSERPKVVFNMAKVQTIYAMLAHSEGRTDEYILMYQEAIKRFRDFSRNPNVSTKTRRIALSNISVCYNNMAELYETEGNYHLAMEFFKSSLSAANERADSSSISIRHLNIGIVFSKMGEFDSAQHYMNHSYSYELALKDPEGLYYCYEAFASLYYLTGEYEQAIHWAEKGLAQAGINEDLIGLTSIYTTFGDIYTANGNPEMAVANLKIGVDIAKKENFNNELLELYKRLTVACEAVGDDRSAFEYLLANNNLEDSLQKFKAGEKLAQFQAIYETDKKESEILILKKDKELQDIVHYALIVGIVLVLIVMLLVYYQFLIKKRANEFLIYSNDKIEEQNKIINQKTKEITDSINYAQRIQEAILPTDLRMKELFDAHFIMYIPKDIVSGDFYWINKVQGKTIVITADCTGHGVPGAFMSIIGHNILDRIIIGKQQFDPGLILDDLRIEITTKLDGTSTETVKDGMDLSVCVFNETCNAVKFAGAYNPLYLVRNKVLTEIKANKMPIGMPMRKDKHYITHELLLEAGDMLYLFSDGFMDQPGGEDADKYGSIQFKHLLIKISGLQVNQQADVLKQSFSTWKERHEQIDDICILGIRI